MIVGLPIIVIAVVLLVVLLRRGAGLRTGRRPRKRHVITRIICGTVSAGILIAVGVGTWQQVAACYSPPAAQVTKALHVPSKPPPAVTEESVPPLRFLVHVMVVGLSSETPQILQVKEFDTGSPNRPQGQPWQAEFRVGSTEVQCSLDLRDLSVAFYSSGQAYILASGGVRIEVDHPFGRSSYGQSFWDLEDRHLYEVWTGGSSSDNPLSALPGPRLDELHLLLLATMVAEDDPLKEISAEEFAKAHALRINRVIPGLEARRGAEKRTLSRSSRQELPPGLVALAPYVGPAGLLLLVAAILLAQLFTYRPLAVAGMLAVMVLYVAVLDGLALSTHLGRLRDAGAPVSERMRGCVQAGDTFFHRASADRALRAVAEDASAPDELRQLARRVLAATSGFRAARWGNLPRGIGPGLLVRHTAPPNPTLSVGNVRFVLSMRKSVSKGLPLREPDGRPGWTTATAMILADGRQVGKARRLNIDRPA